MINYSNIYNCLDTHRLKTMNKALDLFGSNPREAESIISHQVKDLSILTDFIFTLEDQHIITPDERIIDIKTLGGCRQAVRDGYIW